MEYSAQFADPAGIDELLVALLPANARVVVELCCGDGSLGAAYQQKNECCHYTGIEPNAALAALAAQRLDRVVAGNVEKLDDASLGIAPGSVDCLVLEHALEQFVDPWTVLSRAAGWLNVAGRVIAAVANVQHWSVIAGVVRGEWTYGDALPLDRRFVRFFALDDVEMMLTAAGFEVDEIVPCGSAENDAAREQFQRAAAPVVEALQLDPAEFQRRTSAVAYVVRASKQPR